VALHSASKIGCRGRKKGGCRYAERGVKEDVEVQSAEKGKATEE
jgi:hypothetical protein